MARVNYQVILDYQDEWKRQGKEKLVTLCKKFMHKIVDNNHNLDDIVLFYPEECDDFELFKEFAATFLASIYKTEDGCFQMCDFKTE